MGSVSSIFWGMIFGAVGLAYFVYGKKQHLFIPLLCGMTLMAFPYFISNTIILVAVGVGLAMLPFFFRE